MIGKILKAGKHHLLCFINSFFWLRNQLCKGNFQNYLCEQNREKGLVVLATGPSLKEDLEIGINNLSLSDICVVNEFCKHPMFEKLKPTMYVLADPLYFCEGLMGESDKATIHMIAKTNWEITVYVPYLFWANIREKLEGKFVHVCPYHSNAYLGWDFMRGLLYRKGLSMPQIQNVLIPSIFNGINLGYTKIELYGVDHSWTQEIRVNAKNQVCLIDSHFYDENEVKLSPWNKCDGTEYKMQEILRDLAFMFEGYHDLRKYADKKKCKIYNMTSNSFIDAFERGSTLD